MALSLTVAAGCNQPVVSDDLMVDTQAPGFTLGRLGGGEVSLSDYRGKVVLLAFWGAG